MNKYFINETFTVIEGQQTFQTEKPFVSDSISVFKNGILQTNGENNDYTVLSDSGKIIFQNPLIAGDIITVRSDVASTRLNLEVVSPGRADKPNALYKKYGTVDRLKLNNKYEVYICIDTDVFTFNFITRLSPFLTTIKKIRDDIGEFIEGITDEHISSIIYRNSIEVIDLIDELANQEDPVENVTYTKNADGTYEFSNRAANDWVKYKSEIDLIYARYYGISYRYGSRKKSLGDIDIEETVKLPYIDALTDRLKDQWEEADEKIRGINSVATPVKAGAQFKYDDWDRETLF